MNKIPLQPKERSQKLVLLGGGHSHAIALKLWGSHPLPGVDVTLISNVEQTPYSGMLPGHIAGFYSYAETHIDLPSLAQFAGAKLIVDPAVALNLSKKHVVCESGDRFEFDWLSLDIGSTPKTITVPGAQEYAIPAKPVPQLLTAWYQLQQLARENPDRPLSLIIVGGGAGGVELALNMQASLQQIIQQPQTKLQIHLIHRGDRLLEGHNHWVSNKLDTILRQRGIALHLQHEVTKVTAEGVECDPQLTIPGEWVFWVTQGTAPPWIKHSGLTTDDHGFVLVQDTLQSVSHPQILAAGDIATMVNHQRPKAGVFAVRQGSPLFQNWQHLLQGTTPKKYTPQSKYLALIGTGDGQAIASWDWFGWQSPLLWYLKDYIDRKFMKQFVDLSSSL